MLSEECFRHYSVYSGQLSHCLDVYWMWKNLLELPLFFFTCRLNFPWHWSVWNQGANLLIPDWSPRFFWSHLGLSTAMGLRSDASSSSSLSFAHDVPKPGTWSLLAGCRELIPGWFLTLLLISKYLCFLHCWDHHRSHYQCKQLSGETAIIAFQWLCC